MKRLSIILAAIVVVLVVISPPQSFAVSIETSSPHFPYQQWADESKMPTPEVVLTIIETGSPQGCPSRSLEYPGCTSPEQQIVWLAPEAIANSHPRMIFWHEIGHNFDFYMPSWKRDRFMQIMNLSGPWVVYGEPAPYSPNEEFAEVYSQCALRPYIRAGWLGKGPINGSDPIGGAKRHNSACRMISH